jgi:hypothetical protein
MNVSTDLLAPGAKGKGIAAADVLASAQVISRFADAVVANPKVFRKSSGAAKHPGRKGADKNWTQLIERLRVKLNAAEAALSGPEPKAVVKSSEKSNAVKSREASIARAGSNASRTLEALRKEARASQKKLVQDGTLIDGSTFLEEWGFTKQALSKAQAARRLFSLDIEGEKYYPAFFVDPGHDRAQLEKVSKVLGDLPGASKLHFFLSGWGSLAGKTPLEAIAAGQLDRVLNTAQDFVQG